ncbi:DUF1661 domain-containing protein [Porphyromonas gingivalis]|uniref:DUF1661 domain-containing protein n=1 Tax=Porphyromonas gingivalis TaxID=837 RepID=UPI001E5989AE|nr:DUF1661 domain-containing protein [Porphyromonas gingivalis]
MRHPPRVRSYRWRIDTFSLLSFGKKPEYGWKRRVLGVTGSIAAYEKAGIRLEKTWREKTFLLEREVKIFGTKTKNFSRVFSPKHAPQSDHFRLVICRQ